MRTFLIIAGLALAAGAAGFLSYRFLLAPGTSTPPPGTQMAPELVLPTLDGAPLKLSDLRGKLVLVNFWATWCPPCLKEIPLLVEAHTRYAERGFALLGPAMDDPELVRRALPGLRIQYPVIIGDQAVPQAMDALGDTLGALPFSVLISPDGQVLLRKHGEFEREELMELIEQHLPRS